MTSLKELLAAYVSDVRARDGGKMTETTVGILNAYGQGVMASPMPTKKASLVVSRPPNHRICKPIYPRRSRF